MIIKTPIKLFFLTLTVLFSAKFCTAADQSENNIPSLEILCMQTLLKNRKHYKPELVSQDLHAEMVRRSFVPHLEWLHRVCVALDEEYQEYMDEALALGRTRGTQHRQAAYMAEERKEHEIEQFKLKRGYSLTNAKLSDPNFDPKAYALSLTDAQIKKASQRRRKHRQNIY
jgi:hypothetical protein